MNRCVNLDWLEVYVIEPSPLSWMYFQEEGYQVEVRPYGTPMYREMFTLYQDGFKWLEIRRDPYQSKSQCGIFEDGSVHLRLTNRACYDERPVEKLMSFLEKYGYEFRSITRCDICLDFLKFDNDDDPQDIINRFMSGSISKINQCNVSAHGRDMWDGRYWNSLKWGSESSMVTTKLYNKTMELSRQGHDKFYIRDMWERAGLCSRQPVTYIYKHPDGTEVERYAFAYVPYGTASSEPVPQGSVSEVQIWRVEFAIHSNGRHWINMENGQFHELNITSVQFQWQLLFLFHALAARFFHFKSLVKNRNGAWQRKDRCPSIPLFKTSPDEKIYTPKQPTQAKSVPAWIERVAADLRRLYNSKHVSSVVSDSAYRIMVELWQDNRIWTNVQKKEVEDPLTLMSIQELRSLYLRLRQKLFPEEKTISF